MKAKEILGRVEDRLRRLANDCAMASQMSAYLNTERTANMVNDSLAEVREALAALEAEGVGLPWVSVEKRLPHPDDFVFCVNRFGLHEAWIGHDDVWRLRGHSDAAIPDVTHWLPLSAIPLPGQSPESSAGLRDVFDEFRDALRPLRADEEQRHE